MTLRILNLGTYGILVSFSRVIQGFECPEYYETGVLGFRVSCDDGCSCELIEPVVDRGFCSFWIWGVLGFAVDSEGFWGLGRFRCSRLSASRDCSLAHGNLYRALSCASMQVWGRVEMQQVSTEVALFS